MVISASFTEGLIRVSVAQVCQWALDFEGNACRIKKSIQAAKDAGARFRTGPELELSGYSCGDHFLEPDTVTYCWDALADILNSNLTDGILCDIGMPVIHQSVLYNCRVFCFDRKIILIRPKTRNNYTHQHLFGSWDRHTNQLETFVLPSQLGGTQKTTLFGLGVIVCNNGITVVPEIGNEAWAFSDNPQYPVPHTVDVLVHTSALQCRWRRVPDEHYPERLAQTLPATTSVYLYANYVGGDGTRLCYEGGSCICMNGEVKREATRLSLSEVEVITATLDLAAIRLKRQQYLDSPVHIQSKRKCSLPIQIMLSLAPVTLSFPLKTFLRSNEDTLQNDEEYRVRSVACWLWAYLRRSGAQGFFMPLSGGMDSAVVASLVSEMSAIVMRHVKDGNNDVLDAAEQVIGCKQNDATFPTSPEEFTNRVLYTCYLGSDQSSNNTRQLAEEVARAIGSYHIVLPIQHIVATVLDVVTDVLQIRMPRFLCHGGSLKEDIALQNLQARIRMVISYLIAALFWMVRKQKPGFLLVLSTGNNDEALCGYITKYDCSSADINPIGGFSKADVRACLQYASKTHKIFKKVLLQEPSAELRPKEGKKKNQTDEEDMGLSYKEVGLFAQLFQIAHYGPASLFRHLLLSFPTLPARTVLLDCAKKVKLFFGKYVTNRHKMVILTPSFQLAPAELCCSSGDCRPLLYPPLTAQFKDLDHTVAKLSDEQDTYSLQKQETTQSAAKEPVQYSI